MTKKTEVVDETTAKERSPLLKAARKVLLASIGAAALAQDEAEGFINKLVERGEIAEQDAKKLARELVDKRKKRAEKAHGTLDKRVDKVLTRMNIPTKADIQTLSDKIAVLTQKVDELKKTP